MRHSVNGQNNLCWTLEIITLVQHKKVGTKLCDREFRTIAYDMHFYLCGMAGVIVFHG